MLRIVSFGACVALLLLACATAPSPAPTAAAQTAEQMPPAGCVASTGTSLATKPTSCTGPGNTYSFDDLQRTGATTTSEALRLLDPALTIRH